MKPLVEAFMGLDPSSTVDCLFLFIKSMMTAWNSSLAIPRISYSVNSTQESKILFHHQLPLQVGDKCFISERSLNVSSLLSFPLLFIIWIDIIFSFLWTTALVSCFFEGPTYLLSMGQKYKLVKGNMLVGKASR